MENKICMVTGANSGIGKATALGLAQLGAVVVMVCRNRSSGEAALSDIKATSGNPNIHLLVADLAGQESVRRLATEFIARFPRLDVLINNAGTYSTRRRLTSEGLEMTFAVNYLCRFLLTNLLLDTLKSSAPSRVIEVAGAYHSKGWIDFDDLQIEKDYTGTRANNQSKLANVLFTYELARKLQNTGVTVNCLHPGAIATPLIEKDPDYPALAKFLYRLFKPFFKSPEKGAESILYLAASPDVDGTTGSYFVNNNKVKSSRESYDQALAKRLWEVSAELTHLSSNNMFSAK